jgi:hypothetical protein
MGAEGRPSVSGEAMVLAGDGGLAFSWRRKTTQVGQSWAECTGPKGRRDRFRWETEKMGAGRMREWATIIE